MRHSRLNRFESLESRLCLSVSATVTDGDLIVSGDADGAVEIVAVGSGTYQVTDNGVVVADATTLLGVTDDIRISIDSTAGADNSVTLNLGDQAVDAVYAKLGNGINSFDLSGGTTGTANSFIYQGGSGADTVNLVTPIDGSAIVNLGAGDNSLTVAGNVGRLAVRGGSGIDTVSIEATAAIAGSVAANLGSGDNSFTLAGTVEGQLGVSAGAGADTVTLEQTALVGKSARLSLGDGANSTSVAGTITGSLSVVGRDADDSVTLADSASIGKNFFARLGAGNNTVTHAGTVAGNFSVVSKNENDTVDIASTATIGGETNLGLGEQGEYGEYGGGGCRGGEQESALFGRGRRTSGATDTGTTTTTTAAATSLAARTAVRSLRRR